MLKIKVQDLNKLFDAISEKEPLYMPLEKAGEANYGLYKTGEKTALDVLKTVKSAKDLFFPQSETIVKFKTEGKNITVSRSRRYLLSGKEKRLHRRYVCLSPSRRKLFLQGVRHRRGKSRRRCDNLERRRKPLLARKYRKGQ